MKSLQSILFSGLIAVNIFGGSHSHNKEFSKCQPKLSYKQRHDDRAPFIYITVHTDTNTITYVKDGRTLYTGPGAMMRIANTGTDVVVYPTGCVPWDWKSHVPNTAHRPGILPVDVKELVEQHKVDIVILSKGVEEVLQVDPSTIQYLKKQKKEYYILETRKAIDKYNELVAQGKKVGGLFHTTC
jgi:hypothetical protein